jgi:hypothetical protein
MYLAFLHSAVAAILPIFDNLLHHVAITWTNVDGILELLIDGMFMGSWKGVAKEGIVQGSTDFIAGGSKNKMANFLGTLFEVNLWDHVLPVDLLYFMARYKGNDRGNVVNWKGFRPSEVKYLEKSSQNLAHQGKETTDNSNPRATSGARGSKPVARVLIPLGYLLPGKGML